MKGLGRFTTTIRSFEWSKRDIGHIADEVSILKQSAGHEDLAWSYRFRSVPTSHHRPHFFQRDHPMHTRVQSSKQPIWERTALCSLRCQWLVEAIRRLLSR